MGNILPTTHIIGQQICLTVAATGLTTLKIMIQARSIK